MLLSAYSNQAFPWALGELEGTRNGLSLAEPDHLVVCADEMTAVWKLIIYHSPRHTRSSSTSVQPNLPH